MKKNIEVNTTDIELKMKMAAAEDMAEIWEENEEPVRMYLKGCIATARALADRKKAG